MKTKSSHTGFNARYHLKILKALVIATNALVLFMYASIFFVFADMPFDGMAELKVIGNSMAWATGFGVGFSFLIFAGDGIAYLIHNRKRVKFPAVTGTSAVEQGYTGTTPLIINRPPGSMISPDFSNN